MFHTVYKTTNRVNGKYYFGVHKTTNPHDSYLGSGLRLRNAIKKYGAANFCKDVLFIHLDAESAFDKERELVEVFRADPLCMNIREGGTGGFDYINSTGLNAMNQPELRRRVGESRKGVPRPASVCEAVAKANQLRSGWSHSAKVRKQIAESNKRTKALKPQKAWNKGIPRSEETKRRISIAMQRLKG